MNRIHNFSAGPGVLPLEVLEQTQKAVLEYNSNGMSIMEMSHRSKEIMEIFDEAKQNCLDLMKLDKNEYTVLYLGGGASLQFAMIPYNFLKNSADYINTGEWARKAAKEAKMIGKINVIASSEDANYNFIPKEYTVNHDADYVHFTSNNTIFGTRFDKFPEAGNVPLICDMSSDIFSRDLDFSKFSLIYAGAQKNMGPAGATLVVIKNSYLETANENGLSMLLYKTHSKADTMYNTPPVLPVYVIGETLKWLKNNGGLVEMEKRNNHKAQLLYNAIDSKVGFYKGSVISPEDRSIMNVTWNLSTVELEDKFLKEATKANLSGLKGHRSVGGIRASIYNACPLESVQALVDFMEEFYKNNA